jgi:hypothetical protein
LSVGFLSIPQAESQDWERARQEGFAPETSSLLRESPSTSSMGRSNRSSAQSASADGRLTTRSYLSGDNSETYDTPTVSITFIETDLQARDLTQRGLKLDLDATFIIDISRANERRFGETERFDQIRQLSLTQPLGDLTLAVGRRLISQSGNAWVDGADLTLNFDKNRSTLGLYGGLSPDRFDRSLTLDYQALGIYVGTHRQGLDLSGAYNIILFKGDLDRHYLYQRAHWRILKGLFISSYLIVDLIGDPQVTTLLSTLDYSPTSTLNFTLSFTQYALEQYRNQAVYRDVIEPNQALILGNEVINLTYQRLRLSSSVRFAQVWRQYLMVELKSRAQDGRRAQIYTAGITNDNIWGSGIEIDFRTQVAKQFRTDNIIMAITARRDLTSWLSVDGRVTTFSGDTLDEDTDRRRIFSESQSIYLFGLSLISRLSKAHQLYLTYDSIYESEISDYKSDEAIMIHTLSIAYSYLY